MLAAVAAALCIADSLLLLTSCSACRGLVSLQASAGQQSKAATPQGPRSVNPKHTRHLAFTSPPSTSSASHLPDQAQGNRHAAILPGQATGQSPAFSLLKPPTGLTSPSPTRNLPKEASVDSPALSLPKQAVTDSPVPSLPEQAISDSPALSVPKQAVDDTCDGEHNIIEARVLSDLWKVFLQEMKQVRTPRDRHSEVYHTSHVTSYCHRSATAKRMCTAAENPSGVGMHRRPAFRPVKIF